jgi:hypothetical protein
VGDGGGILTLRLGLDGDDLEDYVLWCNEDLRQ